MPLSHPQPSGAPRNGLGTEAESEHTAAPPIDSLKALFGAINILKEDTSYQELASVLEEVGILRMQLKSKEATISQLESSNEKNRENFEFSTQSLVDEHHKHCTKLETHRDELANEAYALRESIQKKDESRKVLENQQAQMQADVAKWKEDLNSSNAFGREERQKYLHLEQDLKAAKGEIDRLKVDVRHGEEQITKLRESNLSLEKRHNDMHQLLQSNSQERGRLQGLAVELRTETLATTRDRIENVWREAQYMVNKHFRFKLPEASEQNAEFWKRLKDVSSRLEYFSGPSVPLPRRDSVAARNMRCALVLAWLMQLIDSELFQPSYIVPVESDVRSDLLREAIRDSRGESFRRAILLSVSPEEQTRAANKRAASVFDRIMWLVEGIVEHDQVAALKPDLQRFIGLACNVWRDIQQLQDRFEPNMDYTVDDGFDWGTLLFENYESSDTKGVSAASGASDEALLVVFPRIYIVKDAEPKPVTSGIVLMKSQTMTAAQEARSEVPKSPTFGKGPLNWSRNERRRDSIIMNDSLAGRNATTFLGQEAPNGLLR